MDTPALRFGRLIEYALGDIIIFRDHESRKPVDESGCNQVAVVIDGATAIFVRGRVVNLRLSDVPTLDGAQHITTAMPETRQLVATFFLRHRHSAAYVNAGLSAYSKRNMLPLLMGDLFPPKPSYSSNAQYEAAWDRMIGNMGPSDVIFTVTLDSLLSRFIAWYTYGPFSHTAIYDGDGYIGETITAGTRYVPITTYKDRRNWVAAFRNINNINNKGHVTVDQAKKQLNQPFRPGYGYVGAVWAGTKAFFGNHEGALTPNSMIYQGLYYCIGQA